MINVTLTGGTEDVTVLNLNEDYMDFNIKFQLYDQCFIPNKVKTVLERHIPIQELRRIDDNKTVAIEKCLIVLSLLVSTIYDDDNPEGWKNLSASILHDLTKKDRDNSFIYTEIIDVLVKGSELKGPIIEVNKDYQIGVASRKYKLVDTYRSKGHAKYKFKTDSIIRRRKNAHNKQLALAVTNPIAKNSLLVQSIITLPTKEEMMSKGRELVKGGYKTNKGKSLTMRNKNSDSNWSDISVRSFVEDDIKRFELLTELGYMVPSVGCDRSGGRVVDSFTLMPSWIRSMCTIHDQVIVEKDYSALHPNICANLYGGPTEMITHDVVAEYLGIERREAKIEHLSFFNKRFDGMVKSPLYEYYQDNHPTMLKAIVDEKYATEFGHKITSRRLFKVEANLMADVLTQLNSQGIYVIYVYDALYVNADQADIVGETMNKFAADNNINTTTDNIVKVIDKAESPIKEEIDVELDKFLNDVTPITKEELDGYLRNHPNRYDVMSGVVADGRLAIKKNEITTIEEIDELLK